MCYVELPYNFIFHDICIFPYLCLSPYLGSLHKFIQDLKLGLTYFGLSPYLFLSYFPGLFPFLVIFLSCQSFNMQICIVFENNNSQMHKLTGLVHL